MIFIEQQNPFGENILVIEEDKMSIWAYLIDENGQLIQDGFICSTGYLAKNKEEVKNAMSNGSAPPLLDSFQTPNSIQQNLNATDIAVKWVSQDEVLVWLRGKLFLRMLKSSKQSFSLAISDNGPYGQKMPS